jgi:hypothetical protein
MKHYGNGYLSGKNLHKRWHRAYIAILVSSYTPLLLHRGLKISINPRHSRNRPCEPLLPLTDYLGDKKAIWSFIGFSRNAMLKKLIFTLWKMELVLPKSIPI